MASTQFDESSLTTSVAEPFQSPVKSFQSPVKIGQSPRHEESLLRLATPLRDRKRRPSVGTPIVDCVGVVEVVEDECVDVVEDCCSPLPSRHAEHLRHRLAELRRRQGEPGHVDPLLDDTSKNVSCDELESYKKAVESTIVMRDEQEMEEMAIADESFGHCCEWQDAATGVQMGYAACLDDDEDGLERTAEEEFYASAMDDQQEHMEVQESYEWVDETSGTLLAYAVCDSGTEEEVVELGVISREAIDSSSMMNHNNAPLQTSMEWKDKSTGIIMGYALCDEEFEAHMEEFTCTASGEEAEVVAALQRSASASTKRRVRSRPLATRLSKVKRVAQNTKRRRVQNTLAKNHFDALSSRHETDAE